MIVLLGVLIVVGGNVSMASVALPWRILGLAAALVGLALARRWLISNAPDDYGSPGVGEACHLLRGIGILLGVTGGIGLLTSDEIRLTPFLVLVAGIALATPGSILSTRIELKPGEPPRRGFRTAVAGMVLAGIGVALLVTVVTAAFVAISDGYTWRYGTPVTATPSDDCAYWKSNRRLGDPFCSNSTWQLDGRTVTGTLQFSWSSFDSESATVPARALGDKAVAQSTDPDDKSIVGSIGALGHLQLKLPLGLAAGGMLFLALVLLTRTPWMAGEQRK